MRHTLVFLLLLLSCTAALAQPQIRSQWEGARVAFLGDSITDARQIGTTNDVYWHMLEDILGIRPYVYGISGHRMNQIIGQGERLEREHGQDVDAIIVFVGTNDYNGGIPLGDWYSYSYEQTVAANRQTGRQEVVRRHRELVYDDATFRGRANTTLRWLKTHYPDKQIIFLTPIHRAFAQFSADNIQPPESFSNACGLFIDDYVQAVQEIANVWAVPVIDLNSISGLYPMLDEHAHYFRNADTDRLHPNTPGHVRMAWALAYQLLGYPAAFPTE
ncbi:MAG: SGNH/GDSL hydrolase family protein [Bacteroidales bacterium]|nr:SGNH/GDSL hydrolase family protein [Bacteroidales bacterium]